MNVKLIRKAIEHFKRDDVRLGCILVYNPRSEMCCAIGEMLRVAGSDPKDNLSDEEGYIKVGQLYGLAPDCVEEIWAANDGAANEDDRKPQVVALLDSFLKNPTPNNVPITPDHATD
jgi:hypothetical protein